MTIICLYKSYHDIVMLWSFQQDISFLLLHLVVGVYSDILLVFGEIDIYVAKDYWLFSTKIIKIRIYEICIIYSKFR